MSNALTFTSELLVLYKEMNGNAVLDTGIVRNVDSVSRENKGGQCSQKESRPKWARWME